MFRERIAIAVFVPLALFANLALAQVKEEVDRFTGQKSFWYSSPTKVQLGTPHLSMAGRQGGTALAVSSIKFTFSPKLERYGIQRPQFIGCNRIDWLLDREPTQFGVVVHDLGRQGSILLEYISQEISQDQFEHIGRSASVDYRICGTEGRFSAADIAAAKEIAARMKENSQGKPQIVIPPAPEPAMKYEPKF